MISTASDAPPSTWADAILVADLLAIDPAALGGVTLRAPHGPVRDAWLAHLRSQIARGAPILRLPLHCPIERLLGGLDLAAMFGTGRHLQQAGVLSQAHGGLAILAMAERWSPAAAAPVASALDRGEVVLERDGMTARSPSRFGLIALDESASDEPGPPTILMDRLAFHLNLNEIGLDALSGPAHAGATLADARRLIANRQPADTTITRALCHAACELGIGSLRAPVLALAVAAAHAAYSGRAHIIADDAAVAARLVLAPRATRFPAPPEEQDPEDQQPPADPQAGEQPDTPEDLQGDITLEDLVLAAARAALPPGLLDAIALGATRAARLGGDGRSGAQRKSATRGRVIGSQVASARNARLNVLATLRAAAPWQKFRTKTLANGSHTAPRIQVRREDFRCNRYKVRSGTTIVFSVDASGSAALHRLAEAKGAVELLLADCYARRDSVALLAFRGQTAEVRLPPSRSLARAKRSLAGLAGGGGTPLATGIDAAAEVAAQARRKGDTPLVVFLTDGRANVTREGKAGRKDAESEALQAARAFHHHGIASILLDTSPQPHPFARRLAAEMGGRYVPLPVAGAESISAAVAKEMVSSRA